MAIIKRMRGLLWVVALLGPMMALADGVAVEPVRIAIVNFTALLDNAPQSKAADAQLKANFVPREQKLAAEQKAIKQLEEEIATRIDAGSLPEEEKVQRQRELRDRQRQYAREMDDFREEVRVARDTAIDTLQTGIIQAIGEVREQEQLDIVLRESNYIVASDRIDITAKVMQHLEGKFQGQAAKSTSGKQE